METRVGGGAMSPSHFKRRDSVWVRLHRPGPMIWLLIMLLATPLIEAALKRDVDAAAASVVVWAAVAACLGTATYLSGFHPALHRFRRSRVAIIVVCAYGTAVIRLNLNTTEYLPSLFTFAMVLVILVLLEGHRVLALTAGLLMLAAAAVQVVANGPSLREFLSLGYLLCMLLLALAWVVYVGRLLRAGNTFDARAAALLDARRADARELIRLRLHHALTDSGTNDVLRRLTTADTVDEELMRDVRMAEASLRDQLSAPIFNHPAMTSEVAAARRRGVAVRLTGESLGAQRGGTVGLALATRLASVLRGLHAGSSVVIRHRPSTAADTFTVVIEADDEVSQLTFKASGEVLSD